ncbi:glutamate receptor 2-like [Penaeus japonicus]|uniref:glutamate receptor 2-like n=1 Tax=Penaeus japonicus TaxID=27405 RepID=UPI001C7130CD|nr:glutamate receptor 2-like [Penaeus japonicus]
MRTVRAPRSRMCPNSLFVFVFGFVLVAGCGGASATPVVARETWNKTDLSPATRKAVGAVITGFMNGLAPLIVLVQNGFSAAALTNGLWEHDSLTVYQDPLILLKRLQTEAGSPFRLVVVGLSSWLAFSLSKIAEDGVLLTRRQLLIVPLEENKEVKNLLLLFSPDHHVLAVQSATPSELANQEPQSPNTTRCQVLVRHLRHLGDTGRPGRSGVRTCACWGENKLHAFSSPFFDFLDLGGRSLVVAIRDRKLTQRVSYGARDGSHDVLEGHPGTLVEWLSRDMNFRYTVVEKDAYGIQYPNGTWGGVIGDCAAGHADIGSEQLTNNLERNKVVDFSFFVATSYLTFIVKSPKAIQPPFLVFEVFSWKLWIAVLVLPLVCGLALWLLDAVGTRLGAHNAAQGRVHDLKTTPFYHHVLLLMRALVYQGSDHLPVRDSGRLFFAITSFIVISLYAVYSGNLVSFLAIPRAAKPIDSMQDIVDNNYRVHSNPGFSDYEYFKNSNGSLEKQIWATHIEDHGSSSFWNREKIQRILERDEAIAVPSLAGPLIQDRFSQGRKCILHRAKENVQMLYDHIAFPKHSPYYDAMNKKLQYIHFYGVGERLKNKYFSQKCREDLQPPSVPVALPLWQMQGPLYIYIVGHVFAISTFLLELIARRCCRSSHTGRRWCHSSP